MKVPISSIKVPSGRRPTGDLLALQESIAQIGLLHPITLREDGTLAAGQRRLLACQALGWRNISATVVNTGPAHAELAEIDENLMRQELTALERMESLKQRKAVWTRLYPGTHKRGRPKKNVSNGDNFTADAVRKTGRSKGDIYKDLKIAEALDPHVFTSARGTLFEDNRTLLADLAKLPGPEQIKLVNAVSTGTSPERSEKKKPKRESKADKAAQRRSAQLVMFYATVRDALVTLSGLDAPAAAKLLFEMTLATKYYKMCPAAQEGLQRLEKELKQYEKKGA